MHDMAEGVCKYDIGLILKEMIFSLKYFSLDTLNNRIESFDFGPLNIRSRPTLITELSIKREGCLKMSASEMLCFTKYLGLIIGDLVPETSELWHLYIVLKQILDIILCKWIRKPDIILLQSLIIEHHELYLKLFKKNLKPKHHHMVHYPFIIQNSGPLSLIWSMRFEAKHKELKETAHSITSRKNITLTLALKQQLQFAYRLIIAEKNVYTINNEIGPVLKLKEETLNLYSFNSIFLSTKFNFFKDKITFISWINVKGIQYSCKNNMSVVLSMCDENNFMMPHFGLIKSIFMTDFNEPFLICKQFKTLYFDNHHQAYNVMITPDLLCCSLNSLDNINPTHHCNIVNGLTFMSLKL